MLPTRWAVPILYRARGRDQPPEGTFAFALPAPRPAPWARLVFILRRPPPGSGSGPACRDATGPRQ
eukprot:11400524-Alexandrium_andersonii.AAC.1